MNRMMGKIGKGNEKATPFFKEVYRAVSQIPKGRVATYGDISQALGVTGGARAIGRAMATNQDVRSVPCHRVVRGDGHVGGYTYGFMKKISLLQQEGVSIDILRRQIKDIESVRFTQFRAKRG